MSRQALSPRNSKPPVFVTGEMNALGETEAPEIFSRVWAQMSSIAFVRLKVRPGDYRGLTFPAWSIGLVRKHFASSVCEFGDACIDERTVHAGEVTVVPPNTPFRSVTTTASEIEYLVLTQPRFEKALRSEHFDDIGSVYRGPPIFEAQTSSALLASLFASLSDPETFDHHHASNYVNAIISDVLRIKSRSSGSLDRVMGNLTSDNIRVVTEYVDSNIDKTLTNECLAQLFNMSETTFARLFKATTGLSPYQFVLDRRVQRAQSLLATTTLPIAQIAYCCGFSSQSHFTSTFKKRVGTTPNGIRKPNALSNRKEF